MSCLISSHRSRREQKSCDKKEHPPTEFLSGIALSVAITFLNMVDNPKILCYNIMKSYDEEAKRYDAFRECGGGVTAQRTAWSIPSEPVGRKAWERSFAV